MFALLLVLQGAADGGPTYHCLTRQLDVRIPRIETTVKIDGVLDEPAWGRAALLTGCSQVGRVFGGAAVHRPVLRNARQEGGAAPRRLVERAVDLHGGLDAGNADVELSGETVVGRAAVGGTLEDEEQGEHAAKD